MMHPLLITLLLMAAAIGCPVAASVTHCMMQTREVLSDSMRERADSRAHVNRHGNPRIRGFVSAAAIAPRRGQSDEPTTRHMPLLNFAGNPPPMGA